MYKILGLFMVVCGVLTGLYVGLWFMLIGGIVQAVESIRAPVLDSAGLAIGIVRVLFSSFFGWVSAVLLIVPGLFLVKKT